MITYDDYIKESGEAVYDSRHRLLSSRSPDSICFGEYRGEMITQERGVHTKLVPIQKRIDTHDYTKIKNDGRLWTKHKVITFWHPTPSRTQMRSVILKLENKLKISILNNYKLSLDYFTPKEIYNSFPYPEYQGQKLVPLEEYCLTYKKPDVEYRELASESKKHINMKYYDYIKENEGLKLDGRHGFFMFLKLIDDLKMHFIKSNHYLNMGKYQYFFTTEHVAKKEDFHGYFTDSMSLKITCETAEQIKDERISFYFGVKNNNLEYGFQNDMSREIYKTGLFKVDTKYIRSLKSYKCLALIEGVLKNSNLSNLTILHEIKSALKTGWYEGKGDVIVLNENIVKKSVNKEDLKDEIKDVNALLRKYEQWCEKFKWINKVFYYIDSEDEDKVTFYIKIKPKQTDKEI